MTMDDIGNAVGVSRRTVFTWSQLPQFKQYVQDMTVEVTKQHLEDVLANLVKLATKSTNVKAIALFLQVCQVIGKDEPTVIVNVDDRSNEFINADIQRLKQQLGQPIDVTPTKQMTKQDLQNLEIEALAEQLRKFDKH
jgi:hypothetical protein